MSVFEGGNPEGWVFRAKRFFSMHHLTKAEKIDVAALSFDSEALAWFQWENGRQRMNRWGELKSRLLEQFWLTKEGSLCEKFLSLKQEGTMREFRQVFEAMASLL